MKLIIAYIKPEKLEAVKKELNKRKVHRMSVMKAKGCGQSKGYVERWSVSLIENLKRIRKIGADKWLKEQEKLYTCPKCGGEICIHDTECFDCGNKINPNIK